MNGNLWKVIVTILGVGITIAAGGISAYFVTNEKVNACEGRIMSLETSREDVQGDIKSINDTLVRLDSKIDRILDKFPATP